MRSCVMFIDDTALSCGLAVSTSRSTVSWRSDNRMSQRFTASISLSFGSTRLESGLTSTSATMRSRANALSAIGWVTKTRGLLTTLYSRRLIHDAWLREYGPRSVAYDALATDLMTALTLGITFSASKVIERLASVTSRQSLPA